MTPQLPEIFTPLGRPRGGGDGRGGGGGDIEGTFKTPLALGYLKGTFEGYTLTTKSLLKDMFKAGYTLTTYHMATRYLFVTVYNEY